MHFYPYQGMLALLEDQQLLHKLKDSLDDRDMDLVRASVTDYTELMERELGYLPQEDTYDQYVMEALLPVLPVELIMLIFKLGGLVTNKDKAVATIKLAEKVVPEYCLCACYLEYSGDVEIELRSAYFSPRWATMARNASECFGNFCDMMSWEMCCTCRAYVLEGSINLILMWAYFTNWDVRLTLAEANEMFDSFKFDEIKEDYFREILRE